MDKRDVFNTIDPGTTDSELRSLAAEHGIDLEELRRIWKYRKRDFERGVNFARRSFRKSRWN